jgi:DNA-binding NarL/FixJ family response regulator
MTTKEERRTVMLAEVRARRAGQSAPSEPAGAWAVRGSCNANPALFADSTRAGQALAICATCPVLKECHAWALRNAVDGVAGGMTSDARTEWRKANKIAEPVVSIEEFMPPEVAAADRGSWLRRSDPILAAVARWTADGESARQIGERLGVTSRSVVRYRNVCRDRAILAS